MTDTATSAPASTPAPAPSPGPPGPTSLQHAKLLVLEARVQGKSASVGPVIAEIPFAINPKELQVTAASEWKSKPAKKPQPAEYTGVKPAALQFEVMLDEALSGPLMNVIGPLLSIVKPMEKTAASNPRPPFVQLSWGELVTNVYIAKQVQLKMTRFNASGMPIRATATIQLEDAMLGVPKQNPTSGGPSGRRIHVAVTGDTLASVAMAEYGDPRHWRSIAGANGIDDPMRLTPGRRLLLPRPDDLPARP